MNWYQKFLRLSEITTLERKLLKDLGHGDKLNELDYYDPEEQKAYILDAIYHLTDDDFAEDNQWVWMFDGNQILKKKGGTHAGNFRHYQDVYKGRFDESVGMCSVAVPYWAIEKSAGTGLKARTEQEWKALDAEAEIVCNKLRREFPKIRSIVAFF